LADLGRSQNCLFLDSLSLTQCHYFTLQDNIDRNSKKGNDVYRLLKLRLKVLKLTEMHTTKDNKNHLWCATVLFCKIYLNNWSENVPFPDCQSFFLISHYLLTTKFVPRCSSVFLPNLILLEWILLVNTEKRKSFPDLVQLSFSLLRSSE